MSSGRYMAYSPSPSASHSPHIGASGLRSASSAAAALVEQEKYLTELLAERNKIIPFISVLSHCYRLLNQEKLTQVLEAERDFEKFLPLQSFPDQAS